MQMICVTDMIIKVLAAGRNLIKSSFKYRESFNDVTSRVSN